jgi:transposase, IS5 family
MNPQQLSLMDSIWTFSRRRKQSRAVATLAKIDAVVNWQALVNIVQVIDKSNTDKGGRKPLPFDWKVKMLFLQYAFNLSDEELEDQLIDRLSFQKFVGINFDQEIPDFTTLWYFKEALLQHQLMDRIFSSINHQLELNGLILKKGTIADATIIESESRPLSKQKREELESKPSVQIDTQAQSTEKNGNKFFGYKGHIGVDVESKLIRKRKFTPANVHDSQAFEAVLSGDEKSIWADKAYTNDKHKRIARAMGIFYGVLDKKKKGSALSGKQTRGNKQKSSVRAAVEHPFAFMRKKLKMGLATAKNKARNALRFDMNCILYNVLRAEWLLRRAAA